MQAPRTNLLTLGFSILAVLAACASAATAELWFAADLAAPERRAAPGSPSLSRPIALAEKPGAIQGKNDVPPASPGDLPAERVEADVSTHQIDVTTGFTGSEVVVFGTVDNSRQPSAEAGYYDVVVIIQGAPDAIIARSKSNVAGLWINTGSMLFDAVPSFYAIATTRPLEEIAEADVLHENNLGFDYVRMRPRQGRVPNFTPEDLSAYRNAVIRLKQGEDLFPRQDFGVAFIGRSLFRASIRLPANVPVGALQAHVYLFREGKVLSTFSSPVQLERQGAEAFIYHFAIRHGLLYGLATVLLAAFAGLIAERAFRKT